VDTQFQGIELISITQLGARDQAAEVYCLKGEEGVLCEQEPNGTMFASVNNEPLHIWRIKKGRLFIEDYE
jgi:hypothetical protein